MWRVAALLLVAVVALGLPGRATAACRILTPDERFERAEVIFSGQVTSTDDLSKPAPWHTTMRVERVWKGDVREPAQVTVSSPTNAVRFQAGDDYLVYGARVDDSPRIHTDVCMGTAPLAESAANLDHLDRTVPKRQPWVAVAIGLLLAAGVALVVLGRPRMTRVGPPAS